jgi:hypothetical protein
VTNRNHTPNRRERRAAKKRDATAYVVDYGYIFPSDQQAACFLCGVTHALSATADIEDDGNNTHHIFPLCGPCREADSNAILRKFLILTLAEHNDDDATEH